MRVILLLMITTTLGSCSYAYDVTAFAKGGRLRFKIESTGLFGSRTPYVNDVDVERIGRPTKLVWRLETIEPNGPEVHELGYAQVPAGMKSKKGPTPLAIGQLYRVTFMTIDGGGYREFAISDDGTVINVGS